MTFRSGVAAVLSAGLLVAGLAGCAVPGNSTGPGARPAQPLEKQDQSESPSPSPTVSASPTTPPTPVADLPSLSGVRTQVTLDPAFLQSLRAAGLKAVPVGDATLQNDVISLPITGGSLRVLPGTGGLSSAPIAEGSIAHRGSGLQLTGSGDNRLTMRNLAIDPARGVVTATVGINGRVTSTNTPVFIFQKRGLQETTKAGNGVVVLRGATIGFTTQTAGLVNQTFGATDVNDRTPVGTVVITAK